MPGAFELVGHERNPRDVVRNSDRVTTDASEYGQVTRARQIRTQHPHSTRLQLNSEQRMMNLDLRIPRYLRKLISTRPRFQNALDIDLWQP